LMNVLRLCLRSRHVRDCKLLCLFSLYLIYFFHLQHLCGKCNLAFCL
jgi:hypothetical protein